VMILSKILFVGVVSSMVYVYFIFLLHRDFNRKLLIVLGFFLGLLVDVFYGTGGVHALITSLIAYLKAPLTLLCFKNTENQEDYSLLNTQMKWEWFLMIFFFFVMHHLLYFTIEYFGYMPVGEILLRGVSTTLLDIFFVVIIENTLRKPHEQRI